jgi:crotonobetainyl-CoA:carnitine CoA-transferase CaiB-like acyl-CoA transferase
MGPDREALRRQGELTAMARALEGVRVVDLSHVIAGPLASFYLAQLGAEVIKVEPPQGEVMRPNPGFAAMNAGKRSLALDIRTEAGAAAVRALAQTADVFIENYRPGVVARYGLDERSIRALKSDIVYCSISGYGQQGQWAGRGAYDHVVQALTGMMLANGDDPGAPPVKVGFPVIDVAVGMLSALAIVASLRRRERDGKGEYVDASMVQAALALMYPFTSACLTTGKSPERLGNRGYSGSPTADTYECADGWLATAANTPAQFRKFTRVLGVESLCEDPRGLDLEAFNAPNGGFVVARDFEYLREKFRAALRNRGAAQMEAALNAVGVPAARVRTLGEFLAEAPGRVTLPVFDLGGVKTAGLGFALREGDAPLPAGAPALGRDNEALLGRAAAVDTPTAGGA